MATDRPRRRTAYRVAGFYALSFALVSLLVGGTALLFADHILRRALDEQLLSDIHTLVRATAEEGRTGLIGDIAARDSVPADGGYLLIDARGQRIAGETKIATPPIGLSDTKLYSKHGGDWEAARVAAIRLPGGETLAAIAEADTTEHLEQALLVIGVGGFGLIMVTGVAGGFFLGRAIHNRVLALGGTAQAIIGGDLARRMPITGRDDEFDQLSATLNRMLDHIGRLMDSLRHVSADVAHDLRTPLARLRGTLEAARAGPAEAQRRGLDDGLAAIDGIMDLFATILRIAEVERSAVRSQFAPVALGPLVTELVELYAPAVEDGGRTIRAEAEENSTVSGDEALLTQALANLVENAIKHTPAGTAIRVTAQRSALMVADDGPGIAPGDRATALRRFGRGEASRHTPGHGLGLTLAAAIAELHGAELTLDDAAPGLTVTIAFPERG